MIDIPEKIQRRIDKELNDNEKVIWLGQPESKRFIKSELLNFFFCLLLTPGMIYPLYKVLDLANFSAYNLLLLVYFKPILFVPFFLMYTFFFWKFFFPELSVPFRVKKIFRNTFYVLTNQRAFSIKLNNIMFFDYPDSIMDIELKKEESGGVGNIILAKAIGDASDNGFFFVENAEYVYSLLRYKIYKA